MAIKKSYLGWIMGGILVAILFATLPFYYVIQDKVRIDEDTRIQMREKYAMFKVYAKDNLTFSNTFIFQDDIDKIIKRYNNASLLEQQAIRQEPLTRKLMEKGIITPNNEANSNMPNKTENTDFKRITTINKLNFLRDLEGKYPYEIKLFDNSIFYQRLEKLLGNDNCEFLISNFDVQSPITIKNDVFVAEACQAHNCGDTDFIVVYDFSNDTMYAGIREEGKIRTYSEKGENPTILKKYATMGVW